MDYTQKTHTKRTSWLMAIVLAVCQVSSQIMPSYALITFQDDSFQDVVSEGLILNSDDTGDENVTFRLGNDGTDAELIFTDSTGDLLFTTPGGDISFADENLSTTGGLDVDGNADFTNASEFHVREVADEAAADCSTLNELVLDTTEDTLYVCTVVGSPGSWVSVANSNLDEAYNNFGAAPSTVTVDAAESQTGGLSFVGSLAADETVTISNSAAGGALLVENTSTGNSLQVNDAASDTTPFVIDDAGDVGIGVTAPARPLQVSRTGDDFGAEYANIDVQTTGTTGFGPSLVLDATSFVGGGEYFLVSTGAGDPGGAGSFIIFDFVAFATRLSIDSAGEVGLGGETAPAHALDITGTGEVIEIGAGTAADLIVNFNDDDGDQNFGWDDSEEAFSTFDEEMILRLDQSSAPPVTCGATFAGRMWLDTDTGITYVCDTSNGRDKWLSTTEFTLTGGESASCAAGASTGDGCIMDIHNGTDANDLGWQVPRNATIVGGSFHSDVSCTDGTGVDMEVQEGDNGGLVSIGDILTSCTDANGCSAVGLNIDVDTDEIIRTVLDNNCTTGSVTDWSSIMLMRWRHD